MTIIQNEKTMTIEDYQRIIKSFLDCDSMKERKLIIESLNEIINKYTNKINSLYRKYISNGRSLFYICGGIHDLSINDDMINPFLYDKNMKCYDRVSVKCFAEIGNDFDLLVNLDSFTDKYLSELKENLINSRHDGLVSEIRDIECYIKRGLKDIEEIRSEIDARRKQLKLKQKELKKYASVFNN